MTKDALTALAVKCRRSGEPLMYKLGGGWCSCPTPADCVFAKREQEKEEKNEQT